MIINNPDVEEKYLNITRLMAKLIPECKSLRVISLCGDGVPNGFVAMLYMEE